MVPPATHRTILVVDVEKFGDQSRTDAQRVTIHSGLYDLLHDAFRAAGISWDSCHWEDRGDGAMVLAPADIPKILFSDRLPCQLTSALDRYNRAHRTEERIRLRMVLHAGEVTIDDTGAVSSAVNTAFRLLDAAPLKQALEQVYVTLIGPTGRCACSSLSLRPRITVRHCWWLLARESP